MPYHVRAGYAAPRSLAAVRASTTHRQLAADIRRLLDMVWPVLREQDVRTGHNVVVYYPGEGGMFAIAAGAEDPLRRRTDIYFLLEPAGH